MKNDKKGIAAALVREISELYISKTREEIEALGVKNAYRPLLSALYAEDGGTQLSLAERTGIKAPTVSITLRKMEKEGMVNRVVDESDLRKTHVFLTEKGKKLTEDMNDCVAEINAGFTAGMSKEQKEFFLLSLTKIRDMLK
ncbi:MAG: winged helix-turn-helix transcriptional regulator [Clostridia bacterium]|nr:winged helix-turn-helix transcriptional regulator [Clostridia bacterium]